MKRTLKNNAFLSGALALVFGMTILTSCNKNEEKIEPQNASDLKAVTTSTSNYTSSSVTLFAGQTIDAGNVTFSQDDVNGLLLVTFNTTNGWELSEIHFHIGNMVSDIPANKSGNPIPGQFAYSPTGVVGLTTYTLSLPYSTIGFACPGPKKFVVAAHAVVRKLNGSGGYQTETGWGDGARFVSRGSWAEYFTIEITCDPIEEDDDYTTTSETAFAYNENGSDCFLNHDFSRWGWVNGPYTAGSYSFDLIAAAGQCDLANGINTGSVTFNYNANGTISVNFATLLNEYDDAYILEEVQIYVGSAMFPLGNNGQPTVAPGQYTYIVDLTEATSYTFTTTDVYSGPVYFIAHAVVGNIPAE
jgi:hypothetical protein